MSTKIETFCSSRDYIDIKMRAAHLEYINDNSLWYNLSAAKRGGKSWVKPYNLPQLLHHDKHTDPVGRVIDYKISNTKNDIDPIDGEPENFVLLTVRISDTDAMKNVLKGLYNTGSVGSSASKVKCSECGQIITQDGLCEHEKGSLNNKGKPIFWIIEEITYRENSFVNTPADSFARIVEIDLGNGFTPYKDFLDSRDELITEIIVEDELMIVTDAKLSAEQRKKLPDSAFCGPGRSFPAHDKAHVTAGLRLLNKSNFSESTKDKIKACLYRKGKKYGIVPTDDDLQANPEIKTYRLDDEYTEEEVKVIEDFFKENPDADLPEIEDNSQEEVVEDNTTDDNTDEVTFEDVKTKTKAEIIAFTEKTINEHEEVVKGYTKEVEDLKKEIEKYKNTISEKDSILNAKEDEISKLLDENAVVENNYKKSLVSNILDLSEKTEDTKDELEKKYMVRSLDSLVDTIEDMRTNIDNQPERVDDPTLQDGKKDNNNTTDNEDLEDDFTPPETLDPKFSVFYQKRN